MASIRTISTRYREDIEDGCQWVAIWKNGRSWCGECFFDDGSGSYEDGYTYSTEDIDRMQEILKEDKHAIMLNGYYTNCGVEEERKTPINNIIAGIEWNYYNHYNTLLHFFEGWVIK